MKKKNLDAYVSFVQSMHISAASRRTMMQMLCDESEEQPQSLRIVRKKTPVTAWPRFERISGLAAMLIVGFSAGILFYSAAKMVSQNVTTTIVCSVPEQLTDTAFSDYFQKTGDDLEQMPHPTDSLAVSSYNKCIANQQRELQWLQKEEERLEAEQDDGRLLNPWNYLQPANTMRRILMYFQEHEADNISLRTIGIGYCKEEQLIYFTLMNSGDEDAVFRTEIALYDYKREKELVRGNAALPLWQRGFLTGYLCKDPLRQSPEGYCITIPAHSAAELTLHIPEGTNIMRDILSLVLYSDSSRTPAYTKYFEMTEQMLLMPRQQEKELLDFAAEHSKLEY
ncbi:MAG: hypothetical protein VZR73_08680 [Acutalibacteraceae bacterium]|nr:hypothetical protein [Acutalibacteraceae bacterium]